MKTAIAAGLIVVVKASKGGHRKSTVIYRLGIEAIAREFMKEPGSHMNPVQIHTLRGFIHDSEPGSPMNHKEGLKTGEKIPPGGGASSGAGYAGPVGVNVVLWNRWVKKTRPDADDLADLLLRGEELRTEGADLDKLVKQALDNNWRFWPRVGDAVQVRGSRLGASDADWGVPT